MPATLPRHSVVVSGPTCRRRVRTVYLDFRRRSPICDVLVELRPGSANVPPTIVSGPETTHASTKKVISHRRTGRPSVHQRNVPNVRPQFHRRRHRPILAGLIVSVRSSGWRSSPRKAEVAGTTINQPTGTADFGWPAIDHSGGRHDDHGAATATTEVAGATTGRQLQRRRRWRRRRRLIRGTDEPS